ncbi:RDD family protein [Microbacterium sp. 22242]|uniref:RDD family protein n=1 Tax=Microbacterium sp. 22242 TaxID=3453896 RepID=UPI003F87390F
MTNTPIGPIAPIARRAVACLIDLAIAGVIVVVGYGITLGVTAGSAPGSLSGVLAMILLGLGATFAVAIAWFVVSTILQGAGASVGMRIMKLRVVRADTGAPLGFGRALLRNVVFGLSTAIVVGYFTPLFDGSGRYQGWHDRASGALVRDARDAVAAPARQAEPAAAAPVTTAMPFIPTPSEAFAPPQPAPGPSFEQQSFEQPSFEQPSFTQEPAVLHDPADRGAATGHTLPHAPSASGYAPAGHGSGAAGYAPVDAGFGADPLDATVTSAAVQAARVAQEAESAMITVVPGISPSVPAPAPAAVSGPEAAVAPVAPVVPAEPAAAPAVAPGPAPATSAPVMQSSDDHDDLESTRISIPGHRLLFVWDDGARATVSGRTLFGRNPAPEPGAAVVVVRDETLSLSKTHFEAAAEAAGGWVMDRHSTNGMTIVRDGVRVACPPGERVRIRLGDAIEIGERIVTVGGYA